MEKTKFYNIHEKAGAKLIGFAGFMMPVQYSSMIEEHMAVRNSVGVFDVSHMGEVFVRGEKALDFVQHITVNNAAKLVPGKVQYSAMCYEDGGIVDDLLVYMIKENEYMLVINASNIDKDFAWMEKNNSFGVELVNESADYSLLAVQGPKSGEVINKVSSIPADMEYYHFAFAQIAGIDVILSRTGYTGELGFEIYFKGDTAAAENLWNTIFEAGAEFDIKPAGLAARDTLRLEMGFCLYGNDIDKTTNTIEAGLGWITKLKKGDFIGSDVVQQVKENGPERKLCAIISDKKAIFRQGYPIVVDGETIGNITSGTMSPVLGKPIALGYVKKELAQPGNKINVVIRNREIEAEITQLPFVKK